MLVNMCTSLSSFQLNAVRPPLVLTQMSPHFSLRFFHPEFQIAFLLSPAASQHFMFFLVKSSDETEEEKKLSTCNLWPCPSTLLTKSSLQHR